MRSGFVSILGSPNAGKSTLLNALIGEKVSIVTNKPQTTRTRIHGIAEVPAAKSRGSAAQIVFVDTPGVLRPESQLDRRMMREVQSALDDCNVVILLVDAARSVGRRSGRAPLETAAVDEQKAITAKISHADRQEAPVLSLISKLDCPVFLAINKIDLVPRERLLPLIAHLSGLHPFTEVIPISARYKDGLETLVKKIVDYLPQGERYFPKDQFTDQPERFLVAELIRERILLETGEEVPYAAAVVVERFEEPLAGAKNGVTHIAAAIYCERPGQKAILIGKGGSKLKSIGTAARKEIESMLGTRVYLELQVIVEKGWRDSNGFVESLNWRKQLDDLALSQVRNEDQQRSPDAPKQNTGRQNTGRK